METRKLLLLAGVLNGPQPKKGMLQSLSDEVRNLPARLANLTPRGWVYQNMATHARLAWRVYDSLFDTNKLVTPRLADKTMKEVEAELHHASVFKLLSAIGLPNYSKALQSFAGNQTKVNEAQIACALERYHLAHAEYPETLDALVPQFIETLPHDIIGGQPLHYRAGIQWQIRALFRRLE